MTNENTSAKAKILDYVRDNKLKIVIVAVVVILVVVFANKKENKKQAELKKIESLYTTTDNAEPLYKTQYFKQIDPKLTEQEKKIKDVEILVQKLADENEELKKTILSATTTGFEKNVDIPNSANNALKNAYSIPSSHNQAAPIQNTPQAVTANTQVVEYLPNATAPLLLSNESKDINISESNPKSKDNKFKMIIPSSSLFLIKLDNGMHLSTLTMAQSHTVPTTSTIVSDVFMPQGRVYDMKGAKMVLEGVGSLSTERGYIKPVRISGFNPDNEPFDLTIQGYVSDVRTGIQGIQGEIISKQEKLFWTSLFAYTIQGVGKGIAGQNNIITTSALGTTTTTQPGKILENGLLNGVGEGSQKVGDEILKIAKNIEPIVEVLGNQYAIVHTTMPFILEYRVDSNSNYNAEKTSVAPVNNVSQINNLIAGGKK
ncbi:MAG: TrbI/VirB10 family protein [Campylobacterota bacterium]|mgnify:CR=1 FL=1